MNEWLSRARDALAETSGLPPEELELDAATTATLLDLARVAAHESGHRVNAPLLCYLIGRAERGATFSELEAALRRAL